MHEYHIVTVVHLGGRYPQARYWAVVNALAQVFIDTLKEEEIDTLLSLPPKMSYVIDIQRATRIHRQEQ